MGDVGWDFTESETKHLKRAKTAGEPTEIIVDEETIDLIRVDRFDEAESVAQDIFDQGVSSMEGTDIANHPAVKASMFETLLSQAHPTALSVGLFGAILGGEISNLIDPSGTMGRNDRIGVDEHSALSGGLGAFGTELSMAGMSGTALGVEALPVLAAGALGAIAGTETQVGVYNALDRAGANTDTKESISDIAGGGVGGAVFSATSIAGAVAMGSEIGAAGGIAGCRSVLELVLCSVWVLGLFRKCLITKQKNKPLLLLPSTRHLKQSSIIKLLHNRNVDIHLLRPTYPMPKAICWPGESGGRHTILEQDYKICILPNPQRRL